MKKALKITLGTALAVSALTPVAAFAAEEVAPTVAKDGFYNITTGAFYTSDAFKALSKDERKAVIKDADFYLVFKGTVYSGLDIALKTSEELATAGTPEVDFEATHEVQFTADGKVLDKDGNDIAAPAKLAAAIAAAEAAITALPATADLTLEDEAAVKAAQALVDKVVALDATAVVANLDVLAAAQAKIEELTTPVVGLAVESVSAINTNYVTVAINESEEDRLAKTVEVKNAAGKVFEVKPLDIAAGDITADFEFVTSVKTSDLVGVWTVDGKAYDLDVFNKIADVLAAKTQIQLNTALTALNLDNYKTANIEVYFTAQQKLVGTVEATDLTVADIQKLVDDANAKAEAGTDEKALIKSIKDAKDANNEVAFLTALNNASLTQVNPDWVATATNGYFTAISGTELDLDAIQTKVNNANETILNVSGTITSTGIDQAKLTASKELIVAYAPVTDKGVISDTTIKNAAAAITEQLAVVDVLEATTPTALKNKLTALATLVDNPVKIDMKNYFDANGKAYVAKIAGETNKVVNLSTSAQIGALLTTVNAAESTGLVDAVYEAADAVATPATPTVAEQDALLKALKNLGLKQVAESNKLQYAEDAATFKTESTTTTNSGTKVKADVQTQVAVSNVAAVVAATDADDLLVALKVLELKNIVDANKDAYLADAGSTINTNAATIDLALKAINTAELQKAEVKGINEATTATEVKTALDKLVITSYDNVPTADKLHVAEQLLEVRNTLAADRDELLANGNAKDAGNDTVADAKTFLNLADLTGHLDLAGTGVIATYGTLVGEFVNTKIVGKTISEVKVQLALLEYSAYDDLSEGDKSKVAEVFQVNYPLDAVTPFAPVDFKTLSAVKKAIDAAIAAPAPMSVN